VAGREIVGGAPAVDDGGAFPGTERLHDDVRFVPIGIVLGDFFSMERRAEREEDRLSSRKQLRILSHLA